MKQWFPLLFSGFGLLVHLPSTAAADPPAIPTPAPTLDQALVQLEKIDQTITTKLDEMRAAIDAEVAAKRFCEPIAQSLRWCLNNAKIARSAEFSTIIGSSRQPVENKELSEHLQTLELE